MTKQELFCEYFRKKGIEISKEHLSEIRTNSKEIKKNDIFIAIRGGNDYIEEALQRGASLVVYDNKKKQDNEIKKIYVEDSIKFLQDISAFIRKKLNPIVVGITGSNGKTTTKDILYNILNKTYKTKKTMGNLNNHIGVPLTLLNLEESDEVLVLEMGMSGLGEIDLLAKLSSPNYGIITNIGDSHLEHLKSRENIFKAKTEMLPYIEKKLFVSGDDIYLKKLNAIKVGFYDNNHIKASNLDLTENGSSFDICIQNEKYRANTNLVGKQNVIDILLAIGVSLDLGIKIEDILMRIREIEVSNMRFQKIEQGETIYINDAYNASPVSVVCSLESFSNIYNEKYKIIVLGDMLELGNESKIMHENLYTTLEKIKYNELYLYGKEMYHLYKRFNDKKLSNVYYFEQKEAISDKIRDIKQSKVIFIKGSRGMKLEEIIK